MRHSRDLLKWSLLTLTAGFVLGIDRPTSGHLPPGEVSLGDIRIGQAVLAGGERLAPGTYRIRLTGEQVEPAVPGHTGRLERYVEFPQNNAVKAKSVATIVPSAAISAVADISSPQPSRYRIDVLRGDEYLRIWFNHRGDHVLLHLPLITADWLQRNR